MTRERENKVYKGKTKHEKDMAKESMKRERERKV